MNIFFGTGCSRRGASGHTTGSAIFKPDISKGFDSPVSFEDVGEGAKRERASTARFHITHPEQFPPTIKLLSQLFPPPILAHPANVMHVQSFHPKRTPLLQKRHGRSMLPALIQRAREVMKRARDTADVIWYVSDGLGSTSSPIRRITTARSR